MARNSSEQIPDAKSAKANRARRYLVSGDAGLSRDDSDDELGLVDYEWEWIYQDVGPKSKRIICGAQMGPVFQCKIGDSVMLKAPGEGKAWIGVILSFVDDEDLGKSAEFMWFSSEAEIPDKSKKKRRDCLEQEIYITPAWDRNELSAINGKANVCSEAVFNQMFPNGKPSTRNRKQLQEYNKWFVCRRACNTRTVSYTDEFVWEEYFPSGQNIEPGDLLEFSDRVTAETKRSRKRKAEVEDVEYSEGPTEDNQEISTPRKKQKTTSAASTPKSRKRHSTLTTPTHKRIAVKKAIEFTPLGTRFLSPSVQSSPFSLARNILHVSSVPTRLPCRENEFGTVHNHLSAAIADGTGACIYISGVPGTGKTATVREVVSSLHASVMAEELEDFIFVEINGMKVTDPHQSYSLLWEALHGDRVSPSHALDLLQTEFSTPSPRRVPCVVLMDELDQLVTRNQSVMYNFFNWPALRHSRLIVLAVANTMDLPERTLSNKISSRLGLTRITFPGYTHSQLQKIIVSRLEHVPGNIVDPDAVQFAARKVAAVSGDARRCLDICRRAVEIAEQKSLDQDSESPTTPSKRKDDAAHEAVPSKTRQTRVTIATIKLAISESVTSPLASHLRSLPLSQKLFLAGLLARNRRTGLAECTLGDVLDEVKNIALLADNPNVKEFLLNDIAGKHGKPLTLMKGPRVAGLGNAGMQLMQSGVIISEIRKGERAGRVRLGVGIEDVKGALCNDSETRGMGFSS